MHEERAMFEPSQLDAVFTTDEQGRINSWTREAKELFGHEADVVIGQPFGSLLVQEPDRSAPSGVVVPQADDAARVKSFLRAEGAPFRALHRAVELRNRGGQLGHAQLIRVIVDDTVRVDSAELRYSEEARVRLLRRLVIAQEEERRRIARDLHDHLGQQLTSLRLKIDAVRAASDPRTIETALRDIESLLGQIDRDIDFLSWELRPAALDDFGLGAVLENYVREWSHHAGVPARFHVEGFAPEHVAPEVEATLYRIAQEALNNVAKHARARSLGVVLEWRGSTVSLVVEDDGVGFEPSQVSGKMIGLVGMRERAAVVGGTLEIEPTAGGGTTVISRVPLSHSPRQDGADAQPAVFLAVGDRIEPLGSFSDAILPGSQNRIQELQSAVTARDEFIATVAHELRNPIAPLAFQVRLSIDKAEQMEKAGEAVSAEWTRAQLRRIEQRLHRFLETLDRILDVSRLSTGRIDLELDNVDLVESVREALASFEAEFALARCDIRVTMPASVTGWWDRLRLDQICRNLISNALRFGAGRPIHVMVEADESSATLTVRDHGVGIPLKTQKLIFERFERGPAANRSGGFGVGLWVVRTVCAAMGGTVRVSSQPGDGSTFTVELPRQSTREQARGER
jgi:PAS domain S-box-containing protein